MSLPVVPVASKKALAQATKWLATKRTHTAQSRQRRIDFMEALTGSLEETLGSLGISKVVVGEQVVVDLAKDAPRVPAETRRWSDYLAQGSQVVILQVDSSGVGYFGQERVDPAQRTLEELVDVALIRTLAPTATLYGPADTGPWEDWIHKNGFQLWVTDPNELLALWQAIPQWVHTDWHDQKTAKNKHVVLAQDVFSARLTRLNAPDLGWRIATAERDRASADAIATVGDWDASAQASIKNALGALAAVEDHPVLGAAATATIEQWLPSLAYVMEGKERAKAMDKTAWKSFYRVHEAIVVAGVKLREWSPTVLPVR